MRISTILFIILIVLAGLYMAWQLGRVYGQNEAYQDSVIEYNNEGLKFDRLANYA